MLQTNAKLYLQLIDVEYQRSIVNETAMTLLFDRAINGELAPEHRLTFSQRKLEFLEDFSSSISRWVERFELIGLRRFDSGDFYCPLLVKSCSPLVENKPLPTHEGSHQCTRRTSKPDVLSSSFLLVLQSAQFAHRNLSCMYSV